MMIKEKSIEEVKAQVEGLMRAYLSKINEGYMSNGKGFKVSFGVHIDPADTGVLISTDISFPVEKVSDKATPRLVNEDQVELFGGAANG